MVNYDLKMLLIFNGVFNLMIIIYARMKIEAWRMNMNLSLGASGTYALEEICGICAKAVTIMLVALPKWYIKDAYVNYYLGLTISSREILEYFDKMLAAEKQGNRFSSVFLLGLSLISFLILFTMGLWKYLFQLPITSLMLGALPDWHQNSDFYRKQKTKEEYKLQFTKNLRVQTLLSIIHILINFFIALPYAYGYFKNFLDVQSIFSKFLDGSLEQMTISVRFLIFPVIGIVLPLLLGILQYLLKRLYYQKCHPWAALKDELLKDPKGKVKV